MIVWHFDAIFFEFFEYLSHEFSLNDYFASLGLRVYKKESLHDYASVIKSGYDNIGILLMQNSVYVVECLYQKRFHLIDVYMTR